jgi:serine/threonine protein kinase
MGDVYEGRDQVLDRRVAVKLFRAASPADRGRFDAEVRLLAGLDHPTLVRVYDAGPHGHDAYLVLELIDGPPLAEVLAKRGALPAAEVAVLGADLADALASIHERNVVHRDVTTSNVLCDPDGRARLVDFGIARLMGSPRVTATLTTVGTAAFMAPEQVAGEEVTPAADVYSLGLVLLELLTGRRPFVGEAQEVAVARLVRDPDTTTDVPGGWRPLLRAMTDRSVATRPPATVVRDRLRALADAPDEATAAVPVVAPVPPPPGAPPVSPAHAPTVVVPVTEALGGDTQMFDVPLFPLPAAPPARDPRRKATWVAVAALAAVVLLAVVVSAQAGFDDPSKGTDTVGLDQGSTETSVTTQRNTATTATTLPSTTVPETTAPPTTEVTSVTELTVPGPGFDPMNPPDQGKKGKRG